MIKLFWNTSLNQDDAFELDWGKYHEKNSKDWVYFLLKNVNYKSINSEKEINKDIVINYGYKSTKISLKKIFQLETDLFPCLVDMKFKGVRIDTKKAEIFGKELEKKRDVLINTIKKDTKIDLKIWAAN